MSVPIIISGILQIFLIIGIDGTDGKIHYKGSRNIHIKF